MYLNYLNFREINKYLRKKNFAQEVILYFRIIYIFTIANIPHVSATCITILSCPEFFQSNATRVKYASPFYKK